jgi:Family of unknown function (DUF6504)
VQLRMRTTLSQPTEPRKQVSGRFVGEAITPVAGTCDTARMAIGEPGLPREFMWRDRVITIAAVLRSWHATGRCHSGSPEMYVRRHWYHVATTSAGTMKIYFDRQSRGGRRAARWWLFSIQDGF